VPDKPVGFRIEVYWAPDNNILGSPLRCEDIRCATKKIVNFAVLKQTVLTIIKVNPVKIQISNGVKLTKGSKYENGRRKKESKEAGNKLRQDE
jgi:hypothetical protein